VVATPRPDRSRRRLSALAAPALAATVALPWAVAAAGPPAAAPAASWGLSPVGQYHYTLAPGATATGAVDLVNGQPQAQTLTLYVADVLSIAGGGFAPAPQGASMSGVGAWLRLGETTVSVPAGATVEVPFTLAVPPEAGPGQYDGAMVATAAAVQASGGMGVSTRTALTVQVSVPLAAVQVPSGREADLATPDGTVDVGAPSGAFPAGASLTLSPASGGPVPEFPPPPAGAAGVVGPLALRAVDSAGTPLHTADRPISVTVQVPPGTTPAGLFVFEFDPVLHAWLPLPTDVRDGAAQAQVDRLSAIALLADPAVTLYPDVAGGWEEAPVLDLEALGVVGGYPDRTFRPDDPVTRAEFAAMLQRALRLPPGLPSDLSAFADSAAVPVWAAPALAAAALAHLLQGDAGGGLDPGSGLSRAEAAVIAARALGLNGAQPATFTDAGSIPTWARSGVDAAVQAGLLDGYPDGSFRPLQPVTRGEAAALILRMLRRHGA